MAKSRPTISQMVEALVFANLFDKMEALAKKNTILFFRISQYVRDNFVIEIGPNRKVENLECISNIPFSC
jgi:hypothetical protein